MTRISLMALVLLISACFYVPPVWNIGAEIDELDFIEPGVTTKDQVLAELGDPDTSYDEGVESGFIYSGHKSGGGIIVGYGGFEIAPDDWSVIIRFDENGVVSQVATSDGAVLGSRSRYATLEAKAEAGDPEAQYELSSMVYGRAQAYRWLCLAAHQSHPRAQHKIGRFYQQGDPPADEDLVQANFWYKLAERNGFQKEAVTYLRSNGAWKYQQFNNHGEWVRAFMTPTQSSEAERLVAEWEPNPAECEQNDAPLGS